MRLRREDAAGAFIAKSEQKQHVEPHRKRALRAELLKSAMPGDVFLPFCGDGDIAADLYADRDLVAIDIDPARIATISARLPRPGSRFLTSSADSWPGGDADSRTYAVADFDSYSEPYPAFRDFWKHARKTDRLVLFFTDGHRQGIIRTHNLHAPDGTKRKIATTNEARALFNSYWTKTIEPWFVRFVKPWRVARTFKYLRGGMLYWGAVVEKPSGPHALPHSPTKKTPAKAKGKPKPKRRKKLAPDDAALGDDPADDEPGATFTDEELGINPLRVGKFAPIKKRRYLELLTTGMSKGEAAKMVGVTLRTVEKHVKAWPGFKDAIDLVGIDLNGQVENAVFQAAKSGNVTAAIFWLLNRDADHWKDKRNIQVDTKVDWDAEVERIHAETGAPKEDIRRELEELFRRRRLRAVN